VDLPLLIRHRLRELGTEQRVLAAAAQVTESYVSQLLTGKKAPPAPERTDIYDRMETFLRLPAGNLARLADLQRKDALKRKLADPPAPLFKEVRELILKKCVPEQEVPIRTIFEKEPFGAIERLVTQQTLNVVQRVTRDKSTDTDWLRRIARLGDRSHEQIRVKVLDFLETDIFNVSADNCLTFFDPLIDSWDIDLETFGMEIVLNRHLTSGQTKRFAFVEQDAEPPVGEEPGLQAFLRDASLHGDASAEEIIFLRKLTFTRQRPTPLYYYRVLQNLRDPIHFRDKTTSSTHGGRDDVGGKKKRQRAKR
jgi:transcriptional regulator with XRE-family HTH domain